MGVSVKTGGGVNSEPNVVPMIDVMLVLLVIFMVVTPALASGFSAEPPAGVNLKPKPEEDTDVILGIDRNGRYFLNKEPIPNEQLGDLLGAQYAVREDKVLYLKAHRGLDYEVVQQAWNIASRSGVAVVAAITDQASGAPAEAESKKP